MMMIPLIFSSHDPALVTVITHLSQHDHKSFKFFPHIQPNEPPSNTAPTIPLMLTTSKVTFSLPLSTQSQLPMHPTLQINFSFTLRSIIDIHVPIKTTTVVKRSHTPGINSSSQAGTQSTWAMLASLEVSLRPQKIPSPMQFSQIPHFQSQILILVQSCNRIIRRSSHTQENPKHNSSSKSPKITSRVPRCIFPTHSLTFSNIKLIGSAPNFHHLIPLIRFFFHLPHLQRWSVLFQPFSLKFTNSFLLLKVNNFPWIPSQLSFWNTASIILVQSSQILSISLFLKEFFHRHSNMLLSSLF